VKNWGGEGAEKKMEEKNEKREESRKREKG